MQPNFTCIYTPKKVLFNMRKALLIMLSGIFCALTQPMSAQINAPESLTTDSLISIANDTLVSDSMPEWYVAPEIPLFLRAPKHTAAAKCVMDSMLSFNVDSVLIEASHYEYDNAGHVIREIVWTYNADGSKTGKSKQEYSFDAYDNQVMTAVYAWDNASQTWKGTEKYEFVYDSEQRMISDTEYAWVSNEWKADTKKTWLYDAEGRVAEYFEYKRNTANNELQYSKGFIKQWDAEGKQTLDIQYTAAVNNVWTAGTKKEYGYDENGNLTLSSLSTISNGAWIGSSKETWYYGGPSGEMTLYETYGWANNDWSKTLRAEKEFDDAGRLIRIENYTFPNGVKTGTKKEEYTFTSAGKPASTITYAWVGGKWVGATNETWLYEGPSGQLTLHEKFEWSNNDWSKTLKEETQYSGANIVRIENYTYANGVPTGTQKELTTYSGGKKTEILTFAWENGDWVNSNKETWEFNGPSGKQTKHEKCEWDGSDWAVMVQENTIYNGNTTTIENYERIAGTWTGTKKEENTVEGGKPSQTIIYAWDANAQDWVDFSKETWGYTAGKTTSYEKYLWENGAYVKSAREVWAYSGSQQTLYEKYTGQNDAWVGIAKEVWAFTSGKQTLHETYEWYNDDWSMTLREIAAFDAAGNQTLIENYTGTSGTIKGIKKEEYTFKTTSTGLKKTSTITYTWNATKQAFVGSQWTVSDVDAAGNVIESCKYTYNATKEDWVGSGSRTLRTYDSNKNVTDEIIQNWSTSITPNGWLNSTRTTSEYDGKNPISQAAWGWSPNLNDWVCSARSEWTYNAAGQNDTIKTIKPKGTTWYVSSRKIMTYNQNGVCILTRSESWKNETWKMTSMSKVDILYDEAGRQILNASWTCSSDSVWKGVKKDTAAYSATGKKIFEAQYKSWSNGVWQPYYTIEYEYDEKDREILNQRYDLINGKLEGHYRYEYRYDEKDRLVMTASYLNWSTYTNNWIGTSKSEDIYDGDLKIQQISYTWRNNDWLFLFSNSYKYDAAGHEIEQLVQLYNENEGQWVNTSKYEKEYRGSELIKNNSYAWESDHWIMYGRNELYYDNDAQRKLRREVHGAWNNGAVTSFEHYYYMYSCDPCIIRFVNYDGTELESITMDKGQTPSYSGATPVREGDAEYSYTFAGWTPEIVKVACSATYTATFTPVKNQYSITWLNDNDTQIDQTTVEYGVMPTHADPTKTNTAEYTYTFTGWTPGIGIVTGDASYKATFNAAKNKYPVVFQDEGGAELQSGEVEYGATPEYKGAEPSKEATAQYTYAFSGWDPEITAVEGAQTYTAKYSSTVNKYTIKWLNDDDTELQIGEVEYGTTPTYDGETPHKDADEQYTYTFAGWDKEVVSVTGEATYKATYSSTTNQYTVKFVNYDGEELQSSSWNYGATPSYSGEVPTKPADDENHYAFAGWSPVVSIVTKDATYTATYSETTNEYTITWFNDDNTLIDQTTVAYGEVPTHEDPTKENTAEWTYTFAGWDHEPVAVTGSASYTATYNATKNKYLVVFQDEGGAELQSGEVEFGTTPEFTGAEPSKEATAQYTYAFSGWDPEITAVEGAQTYTAKYSSTVNKYTIRFINDDDSELQSSEVEYGTTPTYDGETPHKDADEQYTYTFAGWDSEPVAVTGEATYKATYSSTVNQYTVKFVNYNGDELQSSPWNYGATPSYSGEVPTKPADDENHYAFAGWDPVVSVVTKDATYTATYTEAINEYTISWFNDDNTIIDQTTVAYGVVPTHDDPTKENTAEFTYTFAGWDHDPVAVTGNASYKATYTATKNKYLVVFQDEGGTELQSGEVEYGTTPEFTGTQPSKEATAQYTYAFAGWDPEITAVESAQIYTAKYSSTVNSYTITWLNEDGSEIEHETLEYGTTPQHEDLSKENTAEWTYTFTGWTPAIESVKGDASYKATFSETKNSYTITWLNEDGSEIEHETLEYGAMPSHADIYKESTEEFTYTFIGWTPSIVPVNGDAAYKAVFEATPVDPSSKTFTITFLHDDGITILEQVTVEYGEIPVCRYTPTKMGDAEHYYTFVGWSPEIVPATANASYTPLFELVARQYVITFKNYDGKVLHTTKVDYGSIPEYTGATPTRNGTTQYAYVFTGWTPELAPVTKEATYKATFERTARIYTVIYYDEDGETELDRVEVAYGQMPHTSVVPTKEEDEEYYYVFIGWTPYVTFVTKDASYSALFQKKNKLEGIEDVESEEQAVKIFKNNILYILRAGKVYTVDGKLVEEY